MKALIKRETIKKVSIILISVFLVISVVNIFRAGERIGHYTSTDLYENLTLTEKIAAKFKGYKFYTKEEAIQEGIIFSDVKQEARDIAAMIAFMAEPTALDDSKDTQIKIDKCNEALDKLHAENESGRITNNDLISLMNNSISTTTQYMLALKAFKSYDTEAYISYNNKQVESFRNVTNDLERLNKQ